MALPTTPATSGLISQAKSPWTVKFLWLVGPGLVGATLWWWGMSQFVTGQINLSGNPFANISRPAVVALVGLALWLGSSLLTVYLAPRSSLRVVLAILLSLPLLLFFPLTLWTGLAILATAVGLVWSMEQAWADSRNRLTVQPMQTINQNLSVVLSGAMIAVAIVSYQQVHRSSSTVTTARLSGQTVTIVEQFLPRIYSGYRPTMTVDELIGSQLPSAASLLQSINFDQLSSQAAKQQALNQKIRDLGLDPNDLKIDTTLNPNVLRQQLDRQLNAARQQTITEARQQLADRFNLKLQGTEQIHDVLSTYVNQQLTTSLGRFVTFLPLLLAVGVFLLLRLFSFLFTWLIVGWGWLLASLLRWLGIILTKTTTVPAQHLEWHS